MSSIGKIYSFTFSSLKSRPLIFVPFLFLAVIELISLCVVYFSPQLPLRLFFGPIIRTFWGEQFLHYPANFALLPKLASLSQKADYLFFGSLMSSVVVVMVSQFFRKEKMNFKSAVRTGFKKYFHVFAVILLVTVLFQYSMKAFPFVLYKYFSAGHAKLLFIPASLWLSLGVIVFNFILGILLQCAFIYSIPFIVLENLKFGKAIVRSMVLFKRLFLPTLILTTLPALLYIPIIILDLNAVFLIDTLFPEFIFLVAIIGLGLNVLLIDPLITLATTFLFLESGKNSLNR